MANFLIYLFALMSANDFTFAAIVTPKDDSDKRVSEGTPSGRTSKCGKRNLEGIGFVGTVGENQAKYGEFPWMVAVFNTSTFTQPNNKIEEYLLYQCGGSLIHEKVVLTTAHCADSLNLKTSGVRAGEWDFRTEDELHAHQNRRISQIIIHEKYESGQNLNDIALLVMTMPFNINPAVDIMCLPDAGNVIVTDHPCITAGWGRNSTSQFQHVLKTSSIPIISKQECESSLRGSRRQYQFVLQPSSLCAGGTIRDPCKGDSGSPLVCPIRGQPTRYQQLGIVSWGIGCSAGFPTVFTNVAFFRSWIDEQMTRLDFKMNYDYNIN